MKHPKVIGPTVLTGTSNIEVGGTGIRMEVPKTGSILGVFVIQERAGVQTAAEANNVQVTLSSDSAKITPCELLCEPQGGGVGTDIASFREKAAYYPINCPVTQGDKIKVEAKELTACTVHAYVAVTFIFADYVQGPQYKYKVGTQTGASAAAATETVGSGISVAGATKITGVYGIITDTTIASGKGYLGKFRISSSQLKGMGDIEWHAEFAGGILATAAGQAATRISKLEGLDIPIDYTATLTDYFTTTVAVTAAGKFVVGVQYI